VEKLRKLASLKMSTNISDKAVREEAKAYADMRGGSHDLEPEFHAILNDVYDKLIAINRYGDAKDEYIREGLPRLNGIYNNARGYARSKDYAMALSDITIMAPELNDLYARAIANAGAKSQAMEMINQAKRDLNAVQSKFISAPTQAGRSSETAKEIQDAIKEADVKVKAGRFQDAVDAISKVSAAATPDDDTPDDESDKDKKKKKKD